MFSRLFGSKKQDKTQGGTKTPKVSDFSFLGVDMHSHFIPGIDDGAQNIEESIGLIERVQQMGYKGVVTTPHMKIDHYPNNPKIIKEGEAVLRQALAERGINFPVRAAAEYFIDDHFMNILENEELLTIRGNEVLVEISFMFEPIMFTDLLFRIQTKGYRPILAHPERYTFYHSNMDKYNELVDRGCYLQLNLNSLTGYYGKSTKVVAEQLLAKGMYDYCGSDMHNQKHADVLESILRKPDVLGLLQEQQFRNLFIDV